MRYEDALAFLNGLSRYGWRLGLDRIEALCDRMGHPERAFKTIHIAGTNGKGSTSTYLAAILRASGLVTGLFTSPHLYDGRERIKVDDALISREEVARLVRILGPHILAVQGSHGAVTEFEAWTMVMFLHFRERGVDTAVIEAGLGGRWDSTNVIEPALSILTNVSLDHTDRLGSTVGEIARDKAGIIKRGGRILCGPLLPEARAEVLSEVRLTASRLYSLLSDRESSRFSPAPGETVLYWQATEDGSLLLMGTDGSRRLLPYGGPRYGARNAALAAAAGSILRDEEAFPVTDAALETGLKSIIPGRFQIVRREPEVILDGAHNPAAAAALAAELSRGRVTASPVPADETPDLRLVFGASDGHDAEGCLRILAPLAREVILTQARSPRSRSPQELAACVEAIGIPHLIVPDVKEAVGTAIGRSRPYDRVCVTGSFFVLGETPEEMRTDEV